MGKGACWGVAWGVALAMVQMSTRAAPPQVVIVVTCSAHYTDFFENWYAWLRRLEVGSTAGLVAIAEDSEAYAYLRRRLARDAAYRRVVDGFGGPPLTGELSFLSTGFASLMSRRAAHLLAQLEHLTSWDAWAKSSSSRLVFSDLDVLWIRDPTPWFAESGCDAWAQTQHRERGLLNPGLLALTPSPGSRTLLADWAARLRELPGRNLPVFNEAVLELRDITVCPLPPERFLSAKRSFNRKRWSPSSDRLAVVAHANWIDGHDAKRAALRASGAWLLPANHSALLVPRP